MNASKYSACAGFLNISYYFQEWLFQQCKSDSINIPGGQCVDALSFFNMVDAICLSLMRPVGIEEKRISQAYSYLPPRKWPSREAISKGARIIVNRDIGSLEPIEKAGLFSYLGLLVGIPKCCQLWRILGNYSPYYCFPDTRSLFPADSRNLRGLILERLEKENNPLRDTVELWFYLNLRAHRGIKLL
jgi:hypothetical protein